MKLRDLLLAASLVLLYSSPAASWGWGKKQPPAPTELSQAGRINVGLAQNYLQNNDLANALDRANRALASDPNSGDVHAVLGLVYARVGDQKQAEEHFGRAVQLAPTDGPILNAYGAWLCKRGQFDQAKATFDKALQDPFYKDPEQALFNAGKCAFDAGRAAEAEPLLRKALDKGGNSDENDEAALLMLMAQVEFRLGKLLEARAFVQRRDALGAQPDVLELAARIEDAAGDPRAAGHYRQRLRDEFPDHVLSTGEGANRK